MSTNVLNSSVFIKNHNITPIPFEEVTVHLTIQTQRRLAAFLEGPAFSSPVFCPSFSGPTFSAAAFSAPPPSTRVEMASRKRQTYQNNAKNLCTICV